MPVHTILSISDVAPPTPLTPVIQARWQRLQETQPQWAQALLAHPQIGPTCARVFGASEWIGLAMGANPSIMERLLTDFATARDEPTLTAHLRDTLAPDADLPATMRALRQFRRYEMMRITWRDLAGWADLTEVMTTLSSLADTCIEAACTAAHRLMPERVGQPALVDGQRPSLVVFGLGKLGGRELNLSSDIDLIFCFSGDGETDGERTLSHQEYFTRVGQQLIQLLSNATEDGFVFRVDMRLRPNGDSGPLVLNFDAMEHYYQAHGRDWERYALIKARTVTGSVQDQEDITSRLRPFVYRRYLDYRAFDAIRDMRRMIVDEIRGEVERDVKRGTGGIRQIEFIVQTLQLVRGGRLPELRTQRWALARDVLASEQLLDQDVCDTLTNAYTFLRRVEHRLQAVRDEQTHLLPNDDQGNLSLAFAMGYADTDSFTQALNRQREAVNECFGQHFALPDDPESSNNASTSTHLDAFDNPDTIEHLLTQAREGRHYTALTSDARQYLDRLLPLILNEAIKTSAPETTVRRLLDVITAIGRRTAYLALLVEEPVVLHRLARLVSTSAWFSRWLGQYPVLLDTLLNITRQDALLDASEVQADLQRDLQRGDASDLEKAMATLREFHHGHILQIAAADIDEKLDSDCIGRALTVLAKTLLDGCLTVAANDLGMPADSLAIIGYGRLGSGEMNYSSDLDLVFMFDDSQDGAAGSDQQVTIERARSRLIRRVIHIMTTRTEAGDVYELDMRLRPNGRSGTLITTLGAFAEYQMSDAWDWEHQALVRAAPACGAVGVQTRFSALRREILTRPRDTNSLRDSIISMRSRMLTEESKKNTAENASINLKMGAGGLVDIEFIVQYLVLSHASTHPTLLDHGTTPQLIARLADAQLIGTDQSQSLSDTHQLLLKLSRRMALMESSEIIADKALVDSMQDVSAHWSSIMHDTRA